MPRARAASGGPRRRRDVARRHTASRNCFEQVSDGRARAESDARVRFNELGGRVGARRFSSSVFMASAPLRRPSRVMPPPPHSRRDCGVTT